jgi:hypothetical protein
LLAQAQGTGGTPAGVLARFRGKPAAGAAAGTQLPPACRISFCAGAFDEARDPALSCLGRCWIVAGERGVHALTSKGKAVPVPGIPNPGPEHVCRAVAVLPPGAEPVPVDAPRLVYAVAETDRQTAPARIFALGIDGRRRELALGADGTGERAVRDLALDRAGQVYAACAGGEILRLDLAGNVSLLARVPAGAGVLALVLDAATGDLYVGGDDAIHQVTPSGGVVPVLTADPLPEHRAAARVPPFSAGSLALHGRELLIADPDRPALLAYHLDRRRLATLLDSAGHAPTRFGPVHLLHARLPRTACAALGGSGALAVNPEGLCLLAVGKGLATLRLPQGPVTGVQGADPGGGGVPEPSLPAAATSPMAAVPAEPRQRRPDPAGRKLSTRQRNLKRFQDIQRGVRDYKKGLRRKRKREAHSPKLPAGTAAPARRTGGGHCARRASGVLHLTLLGLAALSDSSLLLVLAQAPPPPMAGLDSIAFLNLNIGNALAGLDQLQLGPACAEPQVAQLALDPCGPGYQASVRAQVASIQAQGQRLFADPSTLGAGACLAGESPVDAKARIALAQNDVLADFTQLTADAAALWYQLERDGFALLVPGAGLLAAQAALAPSAGNGTASSPVPSFVLNEAGAGLITGGFGLTAVSDLFGKISFRALGCQARYQKWANSRTDGLLRNCTGTADPASGGSGAVPGTAPAASAGVLAGALQLVSSGCALAARRGVVLEVCNPDSLSEFQGRNSTLGDIFAQGIPCLAFGALAGVQGPCPRAPLADSRTRSDTFATFSEFQAELAEAGVDAFGFANAFYSGSEATIVAANAETLLGAAAAARGALVTADGFSAIGNGLFSAGFGLYRLGSMVQGWQAAVNKAFNAQSRAQLDQKEAQARASASGNGTAALPVAAFSSSTGPDGLDGFAASSSAPAAGSHPAVTIIPPSGPRSPAPAPPPPPPAADSIGFLNLNLGSALAGLEQLGPACAPPQVAALALAPCGAGYLVGVQAQVASLQARGQRLFAAPSTLGAGECLAGESPADAKARVALAQNDVLAEFEQLSADAAALWFQTERDGFVLLVPGVGLLAAQAALAPAAGNGTITSPVPSFAAGEAGAGLVTAGFALQAVGELFGKVSFRASSSQARYQLWANSQTDGLLRNCTGTPVAGAAPGAAPGGAPAAPGNALAASTSALNEALQLITSGCALAARRGVVPSVCNPASLGEFQGRNSTLGDIFNQGTPCLAFGALAGVQGPCPRAPLADSRTRSDTFATFGELQAGISEAAADAFGFGNAFYTASEATVLAANADTLLGAADAARGGFVAAETFSSIGNGLFSAGYELYRIASVVRGWQAAVNLAFNAESRAQLDQKESRARAAASGSGTLVVPAAGSSRSTGFPGGGAASSTAGTIPPAGPAAGPIPSSAGRLLPFPFGWP